MKHRVMTRATRAAVALLATATLTSCGVGQAGDGAPAAQPSATTVAAPSSTGDAGTPSAPAPSERFDLASIPISTEPLGAFPYFQIPDGFENPNEPKPVAESDRVPFWTGDQLYWVEGKIYQSLIHAAPGTEFSRPNLETAVGNAMSAAGAVRVTKSKIPSLVTETIPEDVTLDYLDGLGDIYNEQVSTYVLRRADKTIWIHVCATTASASWMIAETGR